ncbi:YqgE/AlgH family protein [Rubrolithibacter danxiaensis]|uniref:YqgE/AlgH family protein n=1 Tax=Rubrolithibacter danxiaensis TaxID=3390805 RepID=UPI003BF7FB5B
MLSNSNPQIGSLLLSEPFMLDPNFKRSVVLLTEHNEQGTIGYVLNHRSDYILKDVVSDFGEAEFTVYIGGPVANDTLHFIHRCYDRMNSGTEISNGIYWGGNFETLKLLIENRMVTEDEIKFFVGYSGWGDSQLQDELEQNSWLVTNTFNTSYVFVNDDENLWKDVVLGLGPKYAHIANFPENPLWN